MYVRVVLTPYFVANKRGKEDLFETDVARALEALLFVSQVQIQ